MGINFKKIKHSLKFGFNQNLFKFTKELNEINSKENTFKNNKMSIEKCSLIRFPTFDFISILQR